MSEETKNLFDAPWNVSNQKYSIDVVKSNGYWVCECETIETANRLARLPELYDALLEATNHLCKDIRNNREPDCEKCFYGKLCAVRSWYELLRKVRDGE